MIKSFKEIPPFTKSPNYRVNVEWRHLASQLERWGEERETAPVDLDPDFQRGHVWTEEQQIKYIEYAVRGGYSGKEIFFNCAGWMGDFRGPFVLVDGKQRLNAALRFLRNEISAFGLLYKDDPTYLLRAEFVFSVNDLPKYCQVLQWYLDLNTGGTPHTADELQKVKDLLEKEK